MKKIISQGAEAIIYLDGENIIKKRIKKNYRIDSLDKKITKLRTRREGKILSKLQEIIPIPKLIKADEKEKIIEMEFIKGEKLSEKLNNYSKEKQKEILNEIGNSLSKIHQQNIIHGDLTTSNLILKNKVYFIDFGLSFHSSKIEDKAVEIHLFKQALEAKHFQNWKFLYQEFKKGYSKNTSSKPIFERLKKVEKRGRYKS